MSMQVFISYKSGEKNYAEEVAQQLENNGFEAWYAKFLRAGDEWKEVIDSAIKDSFAVIVIVTPESMASRYVTYEWSYAMGLGKRVIPIIYKAVSEEIHPKLHPNAKQQLDFTKPKKDWKGLIKALTETHKTEVIPPAIAEAGIILQSLKSKDYWDDAITMLENSNHPAAPKTLLDIVDGYIDETSILAALAYSRVRNFKSDEAISGLKRAIEKPKFQRDEGIRASETLGKIGTLKAINILIETYEKEIPSSLKTEILLHLSLSNKFDEAVNKAKSFLRAELHNKRNPSNPYVNSDQIALVCSAIEALGNLRDIEALPTIKHIYEEKGDYPESSQVKSAATRAYILISGDDCLPEMKQTIFKLDHRDITVSSYINSLAELGTQSAINLLKELQTDALGTVSFYAELALRRP